MMRSPRQRAVRACGMQGELFALSAAPQAGPGTPGGSAAAPAPGPSTALLLFNTGPAQVGPAAIAYIDSKTLLTPASGFASQYKFTFNPYSGCGLGCFY